MTATACFSVVLCSELEIYYYAFTFLTNRKIKRQHVFSSCPSSSQADYQHPG